MKSHKITVSRGIGYSGKSSGKAYVARITGTSNQYGLDRTFLDADTVTRDHWGRTRYTRTMEYDITECGLYEIQEAGDRYYRAIWERDGEIAATTISEERLDRMMALVSAGSTIEEARLATRPAKA